MSEPRQSKVSEGYNLDSVTYGDVSEEAVAEAPVPKPKWSPWKMVCVVEREANGTAPASIEVEVKENSKLTVRWPRR